MNRNKVSIIKEDLELEVEASTAQEAIRIALTELKAEKSQVDIRVLREENKGLFSMHGAKLAKVNVKKKLH
ncbi:MAG: Jag N-terminal domain-containing protein [Candidatus Omnitrophota bacterium]